MSRSALRRVRAGLPIVASGLAFALACAGLNQEIERSFYADYRELSFETPAELIAPQGLRVSSTDDREIGLAWEPVLVGDVAGYAVLRSLEKTRAYELVGRTESRFASVYVDRGTGPARLGDGQTYHYRIHPYDSQGRVSASFQQIAATTSPRPEPPSGLRAYSNLPRKVALAWDPAEDPSVAGYRITRSPTLTGSFEEIGFADGRLNTVWEDPVRGDLRVMHYRVEAVNRFGAASDPSEAVRAVTKAEPLPPIGLAVSRRELGRIELAWERNVEPDLAAYEIWRTALTADGTEAGPDARIGEAPSSTQTFTDATIGCGQRARYRIRAIDRDKLSSGFSGPLEATGLDLGLTVAPGPDGALELRWSAERAASWPAARIAEIRSALPDSVIQTVTEPRFSLAALPAGKRRLSVTLTHVLADQEPRADLPPDAPPCRIDVEIGPSNPGS